MLFLVPCYGARALLVENCADPVTPYFGNGDCVCQAEELACTTNVRDCAHSRLATVSACDQGDSQGRACLLLQEQTACHSQSKPAALNNR